jgi:dTDP-4-dehydrorhamnose 3,5-epimerase
MVVTPDDTDFGCLHVPPGLLHGFQALTEPADSCCRIDRENDPAEDRSVYDDPGLGIDWPLPVAAISAKGFWRSTRGRS